MRSIALFGALAVFAAAPVAAQGKFRTGTNDPTQPTPATVKGGILGGILNGGTNTGTSSQSRKSDHIPPGQRPPAGMCRVWIDGVPPGQQPAPTDCQTAVATKPANARVIWGDQSAFPGKGKGKFKKGGDNENGNRAQRGDRDDDDQDEGADRARTSTKTSGIGSILGTSTKSFAKHGKKG
jgi:hypothetical protein